MWRTTEVWSLVGARSLRWPFNLWKAPNGSTWSMKPTTGLHVLRAVASLWHGTMTTVPDLSLCQQMASSAHSWEPQFCCSFLEEMGYPDEFYFVFRGWVSSRLGRWGLWIMWCFRKESGAPTTSLTCAWCCVAGRTYMANGARGGML
jgi:hypothetical protein